MPKSRRPRLSWFRFYADDFLGGTGALTAPECGRYLLLLLHQWGTKERQLLPSDPERLRVICRGEDPGLLVLSKFAEVDGGLRNERLAEEWSAAAREYNLKSEGGGSKIPGHYPGQIPHQIGPPTKNQEPRPSLQEGRKEEPPALPPADRAERAIRLSTEALRTKLYGLIDASSQLDPKHRDPTELMRLFTSYQKPDGTWVKGVVNASLLTHERLERSIKDAEEQIGDWNGERTQPA